ncbi:IL6ST [Branchiostoma lanceolatum]|uniref:IL6ST protein n=1 Tax=Branchiostoma lanceolatum TaxID=7740 RepID=A0A8J9YYU6_BRALA|nr:IL6ST [Branchiostoma lanceolatum]
MAATLRQVFAMTLLLQVLAPEATVPPRITRCTCDLDALTVTCSWERGPSDGDETTYTVTYWEDSFIGGAGPVEECTDHCGPSSCTFSPASLFVPHMVVLTRTEADTGQDVRSFPYEITPYQSVKPNAPDLTATPEGSRQVTVSWTSSIPRVFRNVVDESACQLQYRDNGTTTWEKPEDAGRQKAFTLRGLRPYTEYLIRIRCKAEYWGDYGTPVHVRTLQEAPKQAPRHVHAGTVPDSDGDGLTDVTISWEQLEYQHGPILRYELNLTEGGHVISSVSVDANNTQTYYTFRNLTVGQSYQVVLWAVNAAGTSPAVTYDLFVLDEQVKEPGVHAVPVTRTPQGSTTVIILGSVLGGLFLLSMVIFFNRRAIGKRFKLAKAHLWPRIPGPENFLVTPSSEGDYQEVDHIPVVYLTPEPETVDDIAEERRKLLASLPDGPLGGANSDSSNLYARVGHGIRLVSTATDDADRLGHGDGCHGSSEDVANMPLVAKAIWINLNKEAISMATEGGNAPNSNGQSIQSYVQVDHSSYDVAMATGGTPAASSGYGTGGSQDTQDYVRADHWTSPVARATEGDQAAAYELAPVSSGAEPTPREDVTARAIQDYVQATHSVTMATEVATPQAEFIQEDARIQHPSSNVAMATEGARRVSPDATARKEATQVGKVRRAGELSASQDMNDYVQSTNTPHKAFPDP